MPIFGKPNISKMREKQDIGGLVKALKHKDVSVRDDAAFALGKLRAAEAIGPLITTLEQALAGSIYALVRIGDARGVEAVIHLLDDDEKTTRFSAADALSEIGDARGMEVLINALNDADEWTRKYAVDALGRIGGSDKQIIGFLVEALSDTNKVVRKAAVEALNKIGNAQTTQALINALTDSHVDVRQNAAEALDALGWQPGKDEYGATYWIAKEKYDECIEIGASAVKPLLISYKSYARLGAVELTIERIYDPLALKPFISFLDDEDLWVRRLALKMLGKIKDMQGQEHIINALKDKEWQVREAAVRALSNFQSTKAWESLIATLKDNDWRVRAETVKAFPCEVETWEPLVAIFKNKSEHYKVRYEAASALQYMLRVKKMDPPRAELKLQTLLDKFFCLENKQIQNYYN